MRDVAPTRRRTSLFVVVPALLLFGLMLLCALIFFMESFERETSVGRWVGSTGLLLLSVIIVAALLRDIALRFGRHPPVGQASPPIFSPYASTAADFMYDLLFCDRRDSFRTEAEKGRPPPRWLSALFSEPPDIPGLRRLTDPSEEGRIRYLAFARLREAGVPVEPRILLGVIIEVGLDDGLDALAAYSDGGVRYVNHSGKIAVVEAMDQLRPLVSRLFEAASLVVARIGPWDQPRRPPPEKGTLRLTFLVSDGLYFGEGRTEVLAQDALAGPVFREGVALLNEVVATVMRDERRA